jgi:hypothetical protein
MAKRKHSEMIKAWADNGELAVFSRCKNEDWFEARPAWRDDSDYFICLPQHNENGQCLHWLNGGDVQGMEMLLNPYEKEYKWTTSSVWMNNSYTFRIKPKKETRYVVVHKGKLAGELFKADAHIRATYGAEYHELQIFPIEVEA